MRKVLLVSVAAAAFAVAAGSARAEGFSLSFGTGGIAFTYDSGGYCDRWGCPDEFWDYPIYECPVFYRGEWYRGPVYYRRYDDRVWFWVRGGWHRDEWRGPRPAGFCVDQFRPALGFEFYETHGFHMRNEWREKWHREHDRDRGNSNNWWQGNGNRDYRDNNHRDGDRRDGDHRDNKGGNWQGGQNNWQGGQNNGWKDKNWQKDSNPSGQGGQNNWQGGQSSGHGEHHDNGGSGQNNTPLNKNWHNNGNAGGGQSNTFQNKNWHNDSNAGGQTSNPLPAFAPRGPVTAPAATFGTQNTSGTAASGGGHTNWQGRNVTTTTTTSHTTTTTNDDNNNVGAHHFSGGHGGGNSGGNSGSNPRIDNSQTHRQ